MAVPPGGELPVVARLFRFSSLRCLGVLCDLAVGSLFSNRQETTEPWQAEQHKMFLEITRFLSTTLSPRSQAVTEVIMLEMSRVEARASRPYWTGSAPRRWAVLTIVILVTPIIAAIWVHRWFVTQDGSIYLYNTHIILESLKSNNPFHDYYSVRWVPVPYWGAYLLLGALMSIFHESIADLIIISVTSVGFLGCILWLRHKVAGWNGMALVAPFAVILSISLLWLLGFYNFLLGACCYVAALAMWWSGREKPGLRRALLL